MSEKVFFNKYPFRSFVKEQEIFVKDPSYKSSSKYGKSPEERSIEELLKASMVVIDKHPGPTSHDLVHTLKKVLGLPTSHGGTLDPKVSGVLLVLIGKTTKLQFVTQTFPKEYIMLFRIHKNVPESKLIRTIKEFEGEIYQKPPLKSAVAKRIRIKKVYYIDILELRDKDVLVQIGVESGTYARKLAFDIGRALGVGAHMLELRRTKVFGFTEQISVPMYKFIDAYEIYRDTNDPELLLKYLRPMEYLVKDMPKIWVKDSVVASLCHGASLKAPGVVKLTNDIKENSLVALMTMKNELIGIGISLASSKKILELEHGEIVKPRRIVMDRDLYPKMW